ncbi:MAG: hypothetical protein P8Z30_02605 [Acidobacteriota bacterium]
MRKSAFLVLSFLISLSAAAAQSHSPKQGKTPPAHVPEQIRTARIIFISNAGPGCKTPDRTMFGGGPDRAYQQFFDAMQSWGHYTLAAQPSGAELDLVIGLRCSLLTDVFGGSSLWPSLYYPRLKLVIRDMKTGAVLWVIQEYIRYGHNRTGWDRNFDQAMRALVTDLKGLAGAGSAQQPSPAQH